MATPFPTPVTVPVLSTFATLMLLDDQMMRTVGITFPMRSNAVASKPLRSPTRIVTEGGATWTSATFCAAADPGMQNASAAMNPRLIMARECVSG